MEGERRRLKTLFWRVYRELLNMLGFRKIKKTWLARAEGRLDAHHPPVFLLNFSNFCGNYSRD